MREGLEHIPTPRRKSQGTHGTGCQFIANLQTRIAKEKLTHICLDWWRKLEYPERTRAGNMKNFHLTSADLVQVCPVDIGRNC